MTKHGWMILVLAACGGGQRAGGEMPSNEVAMEEETVERTEVEPTSPEREKALADARAAGVLGSVNPCAAANPCAGAATGVPATRDKPGIRGVVKQHIPKITYCYEKQLLVKPNLAGTTLVSFTIAPDGTVSAATGSGFDADVDACVASVVSGMVFGAAAEATVVNYPFK